MINQLKLQHVYEQSTPQQRLVLNQIRNSKISNYVITAPAYMGHINDPEWHYFMMRRIGKTVINQPVKCPYCKHHPEMDLYGNHASSCATQGHRIGRHDRIRDAIATLCQQANIRHKVEPRNLTESNRRPADILVYGIGDQGLALDVGITDVITRYNSAKKKKRTYSDTNGYYANRYYQEKLDYFQQAKFEFGYEKLKAEPIIIENFGYIDPRSLLLLNKLIQLAAKNMNKDTADVNYFFKTKLSYIMAKSDAKAGLSRYYYTYDNSYCRL